MAKKTRSRLSPSASLAHEYPIVDTQDITDKETGDNLTICKIVKPRKNGDNWEDVVEKVWVANPDKFELK